MVWQNCRTRERRFSERDDLGAAGMAEAIV